MIRIGGIIPINIYPIFWVLSFAIGFLNGSSLFEILIWVGIVFASVLIHEYGHAVTALFFGQRVHIDLLGFGGLTHRHGKKMNKWQDFLITLNGPLAGSLFCIFCYALYIFFQPNKEGIPYYILQSTIFINVFWTILNLLPIQPLDGGHLLSITLEGMFGLKGLKIALFISIILATIIAVLGFISHQLFIGIIFFMFAFENYRLFKNSLPLTDFDHDSVLQNMLKSAKKEMSLGNLEGALNEFEEIRRTAKSGVIYVTATESMAEILEQLGKPEEGYQLLKSVMSKLPIDSTPFLQKLAFQSSDWQTAAKVGERAYQAFPSYETALVNALCYSLMHEKTPAIGWLKCAIRDGLPNLQSILTKPEFDNIRNEPEFQKLSQ